MKVDSRIINRIIIYIVAVLLIFGMKLTDMLQISWFWILFTFSFPVILMILIFGVSVGISLFQKNKN